MRFPVISIAFLNLLFVALWATLDSSWAAGPKQKLTLDSAYELAQKQSERLQLRSEDIRTAEARYREAIAAIYPEVTLSATQRIRNSGGTSRTIITGDSNNNVGSSRSTSKHPFESSLGVRQPLFTGFREQYL